MLPGKLLWEVFFMDDLTQDLGSVVTQGRHAIHCLAIIGHIEGANTPSKR